MPGLRRDRLTTVTLELSLLNDGPPLEFQARIPAGRITALVGPSGSGKTSILRAIAGLVRLRRARIVFDGEVWDEDRLHRPTRMRSIGYVTQHYALFPHLTVLGNVEAALLDQPATLARSRALECLELAHIAGLENRMPQQLSGGQRQRVALARAIARSPRVLLLDEPFAAVDRTTRQRLHLELLRLHAQIGMTVVMVTHDLQEAAQLASELILVRQGRSVQAGSTQKVLTRPATLEAARLLDMPNVFEGTWLGTPEPGDSSRPQAQLRWAGHCLRLAALDRSEVPTGATGAVRFAILPEDVRLAIADRPLDPGAWNVVQAQVAETVRLGGEAVLRLAVEGVQRPLVMRLPVSALDRHGVQTGARVRALLRPDDLFLLD